MSREKTISGDERARYGAVVTFENAKGQTISIHRTGPVLKAIASACSLALGMDETCKVVSISTPSSVLSDLTKAPRKIEEVGLLGRIGLTELASQKLRGKVRPNDYEGYSFR